MTAVPVLTTQQDSRQRLREEFVVAVERSRRTGSPVVVSVSSVARRTDPVAVFEAARGRGHDAVLWQLPSEDVVLVGVGAVRTLTASGPSRFQDVSSSWRELMDGAVHITVGSMSDGHDEFVDELGRAEHDRADRFDHADGLHAAGGVGRSNRVADIADTVGTDGIVDTVGADGAVDSVGADSTIETVRAHGTDRVNTSNGTDQITNRQDGLGRSTSLPGPGPGPILLGGFAFDAGSATGPWKSFGDARLDLPRVIYGDVGGRVWTTINTIVTETTDPVEAVSAVIRDRELLLAHDHGAHLSSSETAGEATGDGVAQPEAELVEGSTASSVEGSTASSVEGSTVRAVEGSTVSSVEKLKAESVEGTKAGSVERTEAASGLESESGSGAESEASSGAESESASGAESEAAAALESGVRPATGSQAELQAGPVSKLETGVAAGPKAESDTGPEAEFGIEHSGAKQSGAEHTGAERSGAQQSGAQLSGAEQSGAQLSGAEQTAAQHSGAEQSGAQHTGAQHSSAQQNDRSHAGRSIFIEDVQPKERWLAAVDEVAGTIRAGGLDKAVLARSAKVVSPEGFDLGAALRYLQRHYPECYVFAIGRGDECFLGATPERIVHKADGHIQVACMAGSIARGATPEEDDRLGDQLLADSKNMEEHRIVLRSILAALEPVCTEVVAAEHTGLRKLANVQHLYTPVTARVAGNTDVLTLVARVHPTPAIGGYPTEAALELIRAKEELDRGWYAGPIGWMDGAGDGEFAVGLRSALIRHDTALLFAGCGIMGDSVPESEYEESVLKLRPMLAALEAEQ